MGVIRLLVVDDAFTILSLLDNLFRTKYSVVKSRSLSEAKEIIQLNTPDIVITDLNMPDGSGEELVQYIKTDPNLSYIPIIVLSSTDDLETKLRLLRMGVDDFVQKPFNLEELSLRTENILKRYTTDSFTD